MKPKNCESPRGMSTVETKRAVLLYYSGDVFLNKQVEYTTLVTLKYAFNFLILIFKIKSCSMGSPN